MFGGEPSPASPTVPVSPVVDVVSPRTPVVDKDVKDLQASISTSLTIAEGDIVKEIDQETGEIIEGEELGEVGGKYDIADEEQEKNTKLPMKPRHVRYF